MSLDATTLMAILAMAIVTYATRVAGLLVAHRLVLSGRSKAAFDAIPPAVLVAVIAPTALTTGWAEAVRHDPHGLRRDAAAAPCDHRGRCRLGGGAAADRLASRPAVRVPVSSIALRIPSRTGNGTRPCGFLLGTSEGRFRMSDMPDHLRRSPTFRHRLPSPSCRRPGPRAFRGTRSRSAFRHRVQARSPVQGEPLGVPPSTPLESAVHPLRPGNRPSGDGRSVAAGPVSRSPASPRRASPGSRRRVAGERLPYLGVIAVQPRHLRVRHEGRLDQAQVDRRERERLEAQHRPLAACDLAGLHQDQVLDADAVFTGLVVAGLVREDHAGVRARRCRAWRCAAGPRAPRDS